MSSESSSEFPLKYEMEEPVPHTHLCHGSSLFSTHLNTDNSLPSGSLTAVYIKSEAVECEEDLNEYSSNIDPLETEKVTLKSSEDVDMLENFIIKSEVEEDESFHTIHKEEKSLSSSEREKCSPVTVLVRQEKQYMYRELGKQFSLKETLKKQNVESRFRENYLTYREWAGEKRFTCRKCEKSFSNKYSLIRHNRAHVHITTLKKLFECTDCGKAFGSKTSLKEHMHTHSKVKPYQCNDCGKTFSIKSSLLNHMWIHTGGKMSSCSTNRSSDKRITNNRWKREEKWVLFWAIEYAREKYTDRSERSKAYQKILQHHCPDKRYIPRSQLASRMYCFTLQKVFTDEELAYMKNAVKSMVENQKCPLSEPLEVPTNITIPVDQRNSNMPSCKQLKALPHSTSMKVEDIISPPRMKTEHHVLNKWEIEENWVVLWAFEYVRARYSTRKEQSREYQKIFQHHCPNKKGISRSHLASQKKNIFVQKLFSEEEIMYMKNEVNAMVQNQKCPLSEPLEFPTNITAFPIQRKKNMPAREQLKTTPWGTSLESVNNISSQKIKTELSPTELLACASSNSSPNLEPDNHERLQKRSYLFECIDCGKSFSEKSALTDHMKIHSGEMLLLPFSCHECGKTFRLKQDILSHMRIHTKGKPLFCQKCPKTFAYKSSYAVHMRIHA